MWTVEVKTGAAVVRYCRAYCRPFNTYIERNTVESRKASEVATAILAPLFRCVLYYQKVDKHCEWLSIRYSIIQNPICEPPVSNHRNHSAGEIITVNYTGALLGQSNYIYISGDNTGWLGSTCNTPLAIHQQLFILPKSTSIRVASFHMEWLESVMFRITLSFMTPPYNWHWPLEHQLEKLIIRQTGNWIQTAAWVVATLYCCVISVRMFTGCC